MQSVAETRIDISPMFDDLPALGDGEAEDSGAWSRATTPTTSERYGTEAGRSGRLDIRRSAFGMRRHTNYANSSVAQFNAEA
jgi:hypothetical protein